MVSKSKKLFSNHFCREFFSEQNNPNKIKFLKTSFKTALHLMGATFSKKISFGLVAQKILYKTVGTNFSFQVKKSNSFLKKLVDKNVTTNVSTQSDLEKEILKYEHQEFILNDDSEECDSSLLFYKLNNKVFPRLSIVAKNILCIPGSFVHVESLFSDSGNTLTDSRANLTAANLKACVFFKTNKRFFF